ncbi:MAG: putative porin, partial [Candidatus Poribacteria bacterium]|nr:putative porin [Candidatus Poribacteria bacterium]
MLIVRSKLEKCSIFMLLFVLMIFVQIVQGQNNESDFKFSGDFRLRYENTSNQILGTPLPDNEDARNRQVIRLRAAATKQANDMIKVGARLTTGSSDDPNSTDVTLGSFVNDLQVSLDRLYAEYQNKGL